MLTERLAEFIASAPQRTLPREVELKTELHILDTLAAMVSGSRLAAGTKIIPFVGRLGGTPEASVIGSRVVTNAINAALANGMLAHADETDDSHAASVTHPGCAVVAAALAASERDARSGRDLLRAVTVGYDVGTRISLALGGGRFFDRHHSSHAVGSLFGATAAASAALHLDARQAGYALAYAVQLTSGNACWRRDPDHVEKAFVFGGMGAQHGVLAAVLAADGFTGSPAPLEGTPGLFTAFPESADPSLAIDELGSRYEVMHTTIKKWAVGSPIQSALGALSELIEEYRLAPADIAEIAVSLPRRRAQVVENKKMPDLNLPHQLALLLADGVVNFASSHDRERMDEPRLVSLRARVRVVPRDDGDPGGQSIVAVELADGRRLERQTIHVRGTPQNPMTTEEVTLKAGDLFTPVLGAAAGRDLTAKVLALPDLAGVSELRSLLQSEAG